jgi:hypothetical protein
MPHVLQVLFLSVFILQVVMHGEESQVPETNPTLFSIFGDKNFIFVEFSVAYYILL